MSNKLVGGLVALLVVLGCTAPTAPVDDQPTAQSIRARWRAGQPIRVMVLGNSVSQGFNADGWERLTWNQGGDAQLTAASEADESVRGVVQQLRRFIRARNPASVVKNESGSGYTAQAAGWHLDRILPTLPDYDLAFLPLVINDAKNGNVPKDGEYIVSFQKVIDRLVARGIVPVLVKENDIDRLLETRFGVPYEAYMDIVDQLAARNGLSVVDGFTPFRAAVIAGGGLEASGLMADVFHPSQAGHDILAKAYERWFTEGRP
jgi:lysophospholipase L1-like esterase